ncbi:MAG: glycosyltransferase [Planctomycetes bacterium]|nr:glycosyltransferase [Planctomycetota bacterium]
MRLLLLAPFLPDPCAVHGGGIYLAAVASALARQAEVGLVALVSKAEQQLLQAPRIPWRFLGTLPRREPPRDHGRLRHRLRMLWLWTRLPLVAAKHWEPAMVPLLARARAEFRPDAVLVELAQMAQYLPFLQGLPTVLTDHEAGCPANTSTGLGPLCDRRDARLWSRYVQRFYPRASLVQAVTAEDAATLAGQLGRLVAVREPTLAVPDEPVAPGLAPARALFLGDYRHGPNPEAAQMLVREVLPRLQARIPDAELWLAGPNQERIGFLAGTPGVRLLGFVPDLHGLFAQVRLLLAPLFSGGGFRVKALAALAHGLPVVTNRLGARGCSAGPPACTVAEGADALAAAALDLLRSPERAAQAGAGGFAWAGANLTGEAVAARQLSRIRALPPQAGR